RISRPPVTAAQCRAGWAASDTEFPQFFHQFPQISQRPNAWPRQGDALPWHLRLEPVRARAHRILRDVLAVLLERRGAHRESLVVGQVLQEGAERLLQHDAR